MKSVVLALVLVGICATTTDAWERYQIGRLVMWISKDPIAVDAECKRRMEKVGQTWIGSFLGCTDLKAGVIISIDDPAVIGHEWCHWRFQTTSHVACPVPVQRRP